MAMRNQQVVALPNLFNPLGVPLPFEVKNDSRYAARSADSVQRVHLGGAASGMPLDPSLQRTRQQQQFDVNAKAVEPLIQAGAFLASAPFHPLMLLASVFTPSAEDQRKQSIEDRQKSNEETKQKHRGGE